MQHGFDLAGKSSPRQACFGGPSSSMAFSRSPISFTKVPVTGMSLNIGAISEGAPKSFLQGACQPAVTDPTATQQVPIVNQPPVNLPSAPSSTNEVVDRPPAPMKVPIAGKEAKNANESSDSDSSEEEEDDDDGEESDTGSSSTCQLPQPVWSTRAYSCKEVSKPGIALTISTPLKSAVGFIAEASKPGKPVIPQKPEIRPEAPPGQQKLLSELAVHRNPTSLVSSSETVTSWAPGCADGVGLDAVRSASAS
ncbi:unnamed protein product, partial [Protopolystoma xenopodis]